MQEHNVNVWMINTGWTGGPYGTGSRMKLKYTRAMITAALEGKLNNVEFETDPIFGLQHSKIMSKCTHRGFEPNQYMDRQNSFQGKIEIPCQYVCKEF